MDERRKADRRLQDRLLSVSQVADMAGVPVGTVRFWRHMGILPSVKVGRHPRVWLSIFYQVFQKPLSNGALKMAGGPDTITNARDIRREA